MTSRSRRDLHNSHRERTVKMFIRSLILSLFFLMLSAISVAVGVPHLSIAELVSKSEVIVIAEASEPKLVGPASPVQFRGSLLAAANYSTDLDVKQIIKGKAPQHLSVLYSLPQTFMGYVPVNAGLRIVFLRDVQDHFKLADPYRPSFPACYAPVADGYSDPLRAVVAQLANVLVSPTASRSERNEVLGIDYALPNDEYFLAILRSGLRAISDPEAMQIVQTILLLHGDIGELSSVTKELLSGSEIPNRKPGLLYALGNRVTDVRAVPFVERLLQSDDSQVRAAAAEALWHIGSQAALGPAAKALKDSDPQVRYYAIRALADITN